VGVSPVIRGHIVQTDANSQRSGLQRRRRSPGRGEVHRVAIPAARTVVIRASRQRIGIRWLGRSYATVGAALAITRCPRCSERVAV
jgi:hypothetical protein